jgi:hypothetical protein
VLGTFGYMLDIAGLTFDAAAKPTSTLAGNPMALPDPFITFPKVADNGLQPLLSRNIHSSLKTPERELARVPCGAQVCGTGISGRSLD